MRDDREMSQGPGGSVAGALGKSGFAREDVKIAIEMSGDGQSAILRAGEGRSLELPLAAWADALSSLEGLAAAQQRRTNPDRPLYGPHPGRQGADWSARESDLLAGAYTAGKPVAALALSHQRSTRAVETQLLKLGLISYDDCQYIPPRRNP